jgi:hypothetical protein
MSRNRTLLATAFILALTLGRAQQALAQQPPAGLPANWKSLPPAEMVKAVEKF